MFCHLKREESRLCSEKWGKQQIYSAAYLYLILFKRPWYMRKFTDFLESISKTLQKSCLESMSAKRINWKTLVHAVPNEEGKVNLKPCFITLMLHSHFHCISSTLFSTWVSFSKIHILLVKTLFFLFSHPIHI